MLLCKFAIIWYANNALSISYGNASYGTYMKVHFKIHSTKLYCISKTCLKGKTRQSKKIFLPQQNCDIYTIVLDEHTPINK